jgi:hypothetical protein
MLLCIARYCLTVAVVNHNIQFLSFITDHINSMQSMFLDLSPWDSRFTISMPQHAKPEKRQSNTLGEEDLANSGRDFGKSIANAADDKILEGSGVSIESRLLFLCSKEAFFDERVWELYH